ncbi:hypothetical protein ABZ519_41550 [Streptomyces collinus]|uniref:hypothetical protein n=1 Tax=Streptomyces TaxID=1883 RepID=UPI0033D9673D
MIEESSTMELASIEENELENISGGNRISYDALLRNNGRGRTASQPANPYSRGCNAATRCR